MSAGVDGYMRFWEYAALDLAEPEDDEPHCHVEVSKEVKIMDESATICVIHAKRLAQFA